MRKLHFLLFYSLFLITSCNDGDIITVELEFDQDLALCGDSESDNYVIYDIKTDPGQLEDISGSNQQVFQKMVTELNQYHTELQAEAYGWETEAERVGADLGPK